MFLLVLLLIPFLVLLYCDRECEIWSFKSLKGNGSTKRDRQMDDREAQNGMRGQLLKLPAEWTAYRWIGPCGIRILSEKQSRPIVKKRDFYKGPAKDICFCWSCCKNSKWRKIAFADRNKHFFWRQTQFAVLMEKGERAFRANLALSNIMEIPLLTCALTSILHILNTEPMEEKTKKKKMHNHTLSELDLAVP